MNNDYTPKLLTLLTDPDPFLRKNVIPVTSPTSPEIQQLIADMIYTMKKGKGIGLAAIQVGVDARLIIIDTKDGPVCMINPEIISFSDESEIGEEGCLSVPNTTGMVERNQSITVKSLDDQGNEQTHDAHGLFARVVQHEVDHLNGILFIDKMTNQ